MANLAFNIHSFHYRYYMFIRWMWGYSDKPQRTSLCPYFQTMFWGSICIVLCSPALVLGWVCMKLGRIACKLQNPYTDAIIKYLERKTKWLEQLDSGPDDFANSPMSTGFVFCMMGVTVTLLPVALGIGVAAFFGLLGVGLWHIVDIGAALLYSTAWVFTQLFMIVHWIGFVFYHIYNETVWLFTNGPFWYNVLSWAGYIFAWVAGVGAASVALCLIFVGISKLSLAKRFGRYLTNKFNGFSEAQETRRVRVQEAIKKLSPWKCEYCNYNNNPPEQSRCSDCSEPRPIPKSKWIYFFYVFYVFYPFAWLLNWVWESGASVKRKVGDREIDIIGPLGIVWSYVVAIKRGVCPIVEFVDPAQLQKDAQASAKERMKDEEAIQEELREADEGNV